MSADQRAGTNRPRAPAHIAADTLAEAYARRLPCPLGCVVWHNYTEWVQHHHGCSPGHFGRIALERLRRDPEYQEALALEVAEAKRNRPRTSGAARRTRLAFRSTRAA